MTPIGRLNSQRAFARPTRQSRPAATVAGLAHGRLGEGPAHFDWHWRKATRALLAREAYRGPKKMLRRTRVKSIGIISQRPRGRY